jgi:hypothetical protein
VVRFNPRYIGNTPEKSSTGRFNEEADLIGSKTVKKKLFLDHSVEETTVGRITGDNLGHFGSAMLTPEALNDSVVHDDRFSSYQNRPPIGLSSMRWPYQETVISWYPVAIH